MMHARRLIASIALLLAAGPATGMDTSELRDGEWVSYRDAYRAMVVFEKYGGPKNFLQSQLQVLPRERGAGTGGLQMTLAGKSTELHLALDPLGRTRLPLQKAAYDENAALVLNRKGVPFTVRPQVSIAPRPDGVYDSADLRAACAQALDFARHVDASMRGRRCVGARFVFLNKGEAGVRLRREGGGEQALPPQDEDAGLQAVVYRFGAQQGQVVTANAPLAILPVFE